MAVFMVGLSIFIKDLRDEMGWTLTAISIGFSLKTLETGILAPVSGYLIDRLGPRIMAIFGNVVMTIGLLMFANMDTMWEFYLSSFTIALGQGMGAHMAYITPVMHWFHKKRGVASSFIAMGRGWGYIGSLPITILLVAFGWEKLTLVLSGNIRLVSIIHYLKLAVLPSDSSSKKLLWTFNQRAFDSEPMSKWIVVLIILSISIFFLSLSVFAFQRREYP